MSIDEEYHEIRRAMPHRNETRIDTYRVTIIRQRETEKNAAGPRIWNWMGEASTHGEAEGMAREQFERETGFYIEDHPGDEDADGYIVSAVCTEDEVDDDHEHRWIQRPGGNGYLCADCGIIRQSFEMVEIEVKCPHCGSPHLFRVAANAGPYDDFCEDCEGRFTVDPSDETTHPLPSM